MAEVRIHDAWGEVQNRQPEFKIHDAWATVTPPAVPRGFRIHDAWATVGMNQPVTVGGIYVWDATQWRHCTPWVWNGTEWI